MVTADVTAATSSTRTTTTTYTLKNWTSASLMNPASRTVASDATQTLPKPKLPLKMRVASGKSMAAATARGKGRSNQCGGGRRSRELDKLVWQKTNSY